MTFFSARFIIAWLCWLVFANKSRWKEILPVCFFASLLSLIADQIIDWHIPYWEYYGSEPKIVRYLMNDFDFTIVVTYLFIQWLPRKKSLRTMFAYWFAWVALAIIIEYIHIATGHMAHHHGWSLLHSYVIDWLLFWIFYKYYSVFQFDKLVK